MKILFNTLFFFLALIIVDVKSLTLSDYHIREVCKREKKKAFCIKELKLKRSNLLKGNRIIIPVIPFNN